MIDWAQQLSDDLGWREAELASIKLEIASANPDSTKYIAMLRALWCMLYAHYEGFTKFCWDLFLIALEAERVKRQELISPLLELSLEKDCKQLRGDWSTNNLVSFIKTNYPLLLAAQVTFETKLETNSNLWPNVFRSECARINISCETLNRHDGKLKTLVARRNDIAHGKRMIIKTLTEYQIYEDAATLVMHELAILIVDSLEKKTFLPT